MANRFNPFVRPAASRLQPIAPISPPQAPRLVPAITRLDTQTQYLITFVWDDVQALYSVYNLLMLAIEHSKRWLLSPRPAEPNLIESVKNTVMIYDAAISEVRQRIVQLGGGGIQLG